MILFDSHAHLHFSQFDKDREEIIGRFKEAGIKVINVGTDFEDSKKAIELALKYPEVMQASVGLHPNDASKSDFNSGVFKELAKDEIVVAIGECGLDYFRLPSETEITEQKEIFKKQIEIAKELKKPLVLHCRSSDNKNTYNDMLDILVSCRLSLISGNGVVHFFAGSKETAKNFLDLGFYVSFAGPITFASEYREIVEFIPTDRILVETDAPFAAPVPYRGRRNEPSYVEFVARQIAEWKNMTFDDIANQTYNNAKALFQI